MAKNIFERREMKYLITREKFDSFYSQIAEHLCDDEYKKYTVRNIYYDSPDYNLIRQSIDKPLYKEKLRLRSYGAPEDDGKVYIEIKKKFDKTVYKRRYPISCREAEKILTSGDTSDESQIMREIIHLRDREELCAKMFVAYERTAFTSPEFPDLRITLDENIRYRTYNLKLSSGDEGERLLKDNECVMEIKSSGSMPLWLCRALSSLLIFSQPFSKIGLCYSKIKNNQEKEETNYAKQYSDIY